MLASLIKKESVCRELAKEKTELQGINTELNVRLLDETEKRSKLQLENKDLETQLRDIAISLTNTPKVSEEAIWSGEATSVCNFDRFSVSSNNLTLSSVFIPCSSVFSLASHILTMIGLKLSMKTISAHSSCSQNVCNVSLYFYIDKKNQLYPYF